MSLPIAVISHPDCLLHNAGEGHPEQPARVEVITNALDQADFPMEKYEAPLATRDQLMLAHSERFVDWIFSVSPKAGVVALDADTLMNPHTLTAALRAAGSVILAVDLIMQGKAQAAFCNVRPPGHHAEHDKAMGFCFFNNVAVGAMYALNHYHLKRIAIIDFDVHHGNGTQDIFQNNAKVMYCSSFQHPFYPGYDEALENEHIIGVPLPAGTESEVFRERVKKAWFDRLTAFKPELIFFSAGFDGHRDDPLAYFNLEAEDYVWLTEEIRRIAERTQAKLISVLEGGYNLAVLKMCVPKHIKAMIA